MRSRPRNRETCTRGAACRSPASTPEAWRARPRSQFHSAWRVGARAWALLPADCNHSPARWRPARGPPSENLARREVSADGGRVGRPGQIQADHEGLPFLNPQAATDAVFEAEAGAVELRVGVAQLGPDPARVEESRHGQDQLLLLDGKRQDLAAKLEVLEHLHLPVVALGRHAAHSVDAAQRYY